MKQMLGETIYNLRVKRGLTQAELGELVGVSNKAVSKWETDEANPDISILPKIALALGVPIGVLFGEDTEYKEENNSRENKEESFWHGSGFFISKTDKKTFFKIFKISMIIFFAVFGLTFGGVGLGMYFGFAYPETQALKIAKNESYELQTATVIMPISSNTHINGSTMYGLLIANEAVSLTSNPIFTEAEAREMVDKEVYIRIAPNGRAVWAGDQRSVNSLLGFIFLGVFGGIGLISLLAAAVIIVINIKQKQKQTRW